MTLTETIISLDPSAFRDGERVLVQHGRLAASGFLFSSGVCGVRLKNELGNVILLPFQGQQVWSAEFGGRNLAMRSLFTEPRPVHEFLENFGGLLLHCGATAMGSPSKEDTHPLHGELPNAPYSTAFLAIGEDERGEYIGLGGEYVHIVAFGSCYSARPSLRLHGGSSLLAMSMTISNLRNSPMELMYLAHINFRPVDDGRLVYSAPCDPEHIHVRSSLPGFIQPRAGYLEFIEELKHHPEKHNVLRAELIFDPEVVFGIRYLADAQGWAHCMQVHPDGSADYVRHRPDQLDHGIRWISRTADQDALGFEPATAEVEGYLAEKRKGNIKVLPPKGQFHCNVEFGALSPREVKDVEARIEEALSRSTRSA
jgi:hypothetical protein